MKIRATEYKKIIEENIEMSIGMTLIEWREFREWCGYYELRSKVSRKEWAYKKNRLLKEWHNEK